MIEVFNWIKDNWNDVLAIYGGVVAICTIITRLTPSTKDNEVLDKIVKVIDCFSTCFTKSDKDKLNK